MIVCDESYFPSLEAISKLHYAPEGEFVKDHSFVYHNGLFHLFSISGPAGTTWQDSGSEERFSHSISSDLVNWEFTEHVLAINWYGKEDKSKIWAPFVIEHNGVFHIFYSGISYNEPRKSPGDYTIRTCHAVSKDLKTWEKRPAVPPPPEGIVECQDAHVYHDAETGKFYLYCIGGSNRVTGVIVRTSTDLETWRPAKVCFRIRLEDMPYRSTHPTESPFVLKHEGNLFLLLNDGYAVGNEPDGGFTGFRPYGQRLPGFACEVLRFGNRYLRSAVHGSRGYYRLVMCEMQIEGLDIRFIT
ncbi:MAG: family 43 glycosylhydrolase [Sedimentisphaerales bacterium]|nr:family 43 glycosylhydrolase [Sedimentisphaerales bacterium]